MGGVVSLDPEDLPGLDIQDPRDQPRPQPQEPEQPAQPQPEPEPEPPRPSAPRPRPIPLGTPSTPPPRPGPLPAPDGVIRGQGDPDGPGGPRVDDPPLPDGPNQGVALVRDDRPGGPDPDRQDIEPPTPPGSRGPLGTIFTGTTGLLASRFPGPRRKTLLGG